MRKVYIFLGILFFLTSCKSSQKSGQSECVIVTFHFDKNEKYNGKINLINSVVFDTTATLIHGYVTDQETNKPLENTIIIFFDGQEQYLDTTNNKGEFEIFKNISKRQWNIKLIKLKYQCLIVEDVIHAGGQWFNFKLTKE